jgi:hypothetical protein
MSDGEGAAVCRSSPKGSQTARKDSARKQESAWKSEEDQANKREWSLFGACSSDEDGRAEPAAMVAGYKIDAEARQLLGEFVEAAPNEAVALALSPPTKTTVPSPHPPERPVPLHHPQQALSLKQPPPCVINGRRPRTRRAPHNRHRRSSGTLPIDG